MANNVIAAGFGIHQRNGSRTQKALGGRLSGIESGRDSNAEGRALWPQTDQKGKQ